MQNWLVAIGLLFAGCAPNRAEVMRRHELLDVTAAPDARGGGSAAVIAAMDAVDRLSAARCARERRCDRLGPHNSYNTIEQCLHADLISRLDAFDPAACPRGVRDDVVGACVAAMNEEHCGSDFASAGCTARALCFE